MTERPIRVFQVATGNVGSEMIKRLGPHPDLELVEIWFNLYVGVAWNNERPLFADPEVRRALTLAIDRQTIVDTVLGEYGRVATSPIMSNVWAHDRSIEPWPYDPAEAGPADERLDPVGIAERELARLALLRRLL